MAEEQGKCKYHSSENKAFCKFTDRPCFGAYFDEFKQEYVIDIWKEQECPNYKYDDSLLWGKEAPAGGFDLKKVFEEQKREALASAQVEVIEGEVEDSESGKVEIVLFGVRVPLECTEDGCDVPESIDVDAEVLQHYFNRKYGPNLIEVKWVDVMSPDLEDYPEVNDYIAQHDTYPIVTINGLIKFVGSISVDLINKELEKLGLKRRQLD